MAAQENRLVVEHRGRIARPIQEVQRQFGDMHHHANNRVHKALDIKVIADDGTTCRYTFDVRILGLRQHDEVELTRRKDGSLYAETVSGTNVGTRNTVTFKPDGKDATIVHFQLDPPVSGFKRLIKPLFAMGVRREVRKAFKEDRHDLEVVGYPRKAEATKAA